MEEKIDNLTNLVDQLAISMVKNLEYTQGMEERLSNKIDAINNRVDDVAQIKATKEDLKNLDIRVTKIENKVLA